MKFTRRPDLEPQTRIEIVKLVWLYGPVGAFEQEPTVLNKSLRRKYLFDGI